VGADLTLLAVLATTAGLIGAATLPAPTFVAACLIAIAAFEPIVGLPAAITALARARAGSARLTELLPDATAPAGTTHLLDAPPWPLEITSRRTASRPL
jgi:ABC-type transport system involved in cytochrome bd biosynthesis fused ATPase/permease subunit